MASFTSVPIFSDHKDLIHDVSFDHHGKRIATCSSDQSVKIWDLNEKGAWVCSASWKTHSGPVWRVTWAHPEFGQIIATCSFDRTALIWEEVVSESEGGFRPRGREGFRTHWVRRCSLVDSRSNVTDVKFAPKHFGLQLATCSQNGVVRVYEAPDVMNLSQFNLQHDLPVSKHRCSAISWNTSRYHPPLIAVGCDDPTATTGPKVTLFEYNDSLRKWSRVDGLSTIGEPVYDVSFAPNVGRSYHLLAIASKNVHIFSLKPYQQIGEGSEPSTPGSGVAGQIGSLSRFEVKEMAVLDQHQSHVWRVSWNVTGTVLASSGADGTVKLWKANYLDNWKCVTTLTEDERKGMVQDVPFDGGY